MGIEEKLIDYYVYDQARFHKELESLSKNENYAICSCILFTKSHLYQSQKSALVHEKINSISIESQTPILAFFFYLYWFIFDVQNLREEEASIVLSKMETCMKDDFPVFLKAEFLMCKAQILSPENAEKLYKEGLSLLPVKSERYQNGIKTLFDKYSREGRLKEVEPKYFDSLSKEFNDVFSFINAVENGQTEDALKFREHIFIDKMLLPRPAKIRIENSIALLELYLGHKDTIELNGWMMPVKALLDNDPSFALTSAKEFYDKYQPQINIMTNFGGFTLIRAQLSNKNIDAAKLIVENWSGDLDKNIFADFFIARLELLNNHPEKALGHFAKILAYCRENNAMGRLDFELELALELQPKQIRFLMEGANSILSSTTIPIERVLVKEQKKEDVGINRIKGASFIIKSIKDEIQKFARLDIPVLILGETGVGKDLIANAIHEESNRKAEPFLAINCSAIAESLLLSELFGHEAGAYTGANKAHKGIFQEAGEGTVFLDEIGDISNGLQTALLRVLDSGEYRPVGSAKPRFVKCRIIAATNAFLESRVDDGTFRLDLLFRLKRLVIQVPPLRERPVDISFLAKYYLGLNRVAESNPKISRELEDAFLAYSWPGNVRELKNEMEKIRLLHSGKSPYGLEDASFLNKKNRGETKKEYEPLFINEVLEKKPEVESKTYQKSRISLHEEVFQKSGSYFRRLDIIKNLFIEHKKLSRKEICQITGIANLTLGRDLKSLREDNFIRKVEPTKAPRTHYFVLKED